MEVGHQVGSGGKPNGEHSGSDRAWWAGAWAAVALGVGLRLWGLGGQDLTFDEAFTGAAAVRPIGSLFDFLRVSDTHPPLDYLLRRPFASSGSELLLRLPSAACSVVMLLVLAHWLRDRGPFGALTVMVASVLQLFVLHGREARMYSVVMLLGLLASFAAERWLRQPSNRRAVGVAVPGALALLSHSATIPAVAALILLPGLRRDRDAWVFRAWIAAAFGVWGLLWGPSFAEQSSVVSSFWIPLTTPNWLETVGASMLTPRTALVHFSFVSLVLGVVALLMRRDGVARVALLVFALPFVAVAVAGLELHLLLPRSFAFGAWAVAAALGAGIDWLRRVAGGRGAAVGLALAVVLLVPASLDVVQHGREDLVEMDVLQQRLEPGDAVSISPAWFRPLLEWNLVVKRGFDVIGERDGRFVVVDPTGAPSGRTHLLDHRQLPMADAADGSDSCARPFARWSWLVRCIEQR